jgi:hypothetical protein
MRNKWTLFEYNVGVTLSFSKQHSLEYMFILIGANASNDDEFLTEIIL